MSYSEYVFITHRFYGKFESVGDWVQQVIEGMMGLFFVIVLVFCGFGIASAIGTESEALTFKTQTITLLEDCNYDKEVLAASYITAKQKGFTLSVRLFYEDGTIVELEEESIDSMNTSGVTMAEVTVGYPFRIGMLKIDDQLEISGVAN